MTCNNILFNALKIDPMHASMERLYRVAKEKRKIAGQSALARELNVSPQVVKNWEARGISKDGAMAAQHIFACDSNWLMGHALYMTARDQAAMHRVEEDTPPAPAIAWPFRRVTSTQWLALSSAQQRHIEDGVLLLVQGNHDIKAHQSASGQVPIAITELGRKNKQPPRKPKRGDRHAA